MTHTRGALLALSCTLLLVPVACGGGGGDTDTTTASGSESGDTTAGPTDGTDPSATDSATDPSGTETDSGSSGTEPTDTTDTTDTGPNPNIECDPSKQDCPMGEKCTPYVKEGDGCCVDATHCVPDDGDLQEGDDCTRLNGTDDCDIGLFCHPPTSGQEGPGVCVPLCDPEDPNTCNGTCYAWNDGVLPLCDVECDPLLQNCPNKHGCYPLLSLQQFVCIVIGAIPPDGAVGDLCETVQGCQPGLSCQSADILEVCDGTDCCTPICDITGAPDQCPNAMEECVSVWPEGDVPPNYADVGFCMIPA